jgi:hypothetical protein
VAAFVSYIGTYVCGWLHRYHIYLCIWVAT